MTETILETIPMLPLGMLNAYLLVGKGSAVLVDTGLPGSEHRVEGALRRHGLSLSALRFVILTHGHIDHAGSAASISRLSGAPVVAHRDELPYLGGASPVLRPTGPFGRMFHKTGAIERPFAYLTPDLVVDSPVHDLDCGGFSLRFVHTPGHTPGSISVLAGLNRVIAGDLAASGVLLGGIMLRNRPKRPPFEELPRDVATALRHLLSLGCTRFWLGHGGPLGEREIRAHLRNLEALDGQ
jgi:glyoxylase-like metal-dependent hydrolase (beta-lactamase superfamily II)